MAEEATIVVPCFNEAARFDETPFLRLSHQDGMSVLMVNDGSTDATGELLARLASKSDAIAVLDLATNAGKGEAVRRGLLEAVGDGAAIVGYYDADAATPPDQLLRLVDAVKANPRLSAVFGARVARLGSDIRRSELRHYAGRVYDTLASVALGMDVYDTQCGAKVFRSGIALKEALAMPFPSRSAFDVWLIHRLATGSDRAPPVPPEAFMEIPLDAWRDEGGSRVRLSDALIALVEIVQLISKRVVGKRLRSVNGGKP